MQDGDDAPLEFTSISALVPVAEMFFPAPAGEYRLLLGSEEATRPVYELDKIRRVVLAASHATAEVGELR